ncbi:hypothetical protein DOY81_009267 [Sarcophaga bullata]|nr:hypothetical protein DOY81_009267 [Sarcophaga bullata]
MRVTMQLMLKLTRGKHLRITGFLWKFFGLQPPKRDSKWFKPYIVYAIFVNMTVTLFFPTTLIVNLILSQNLTELCENLYMTTTDVICNIKFVNVFVVRHKLLKVRTILQRLDARVCTPEELDVLQKGIRSARQCFTIFLRLFCVAVITSQLVVYLSNERILMYPAWFPWDWRASKSNFLYAHTYQLYGLTMQALQDLGNDTYPQAYLVILTAHIKALALRIKSLGKGVAVHTSDTELYQQLIDCIKDHKTIFELFLTIQDTISFTCLAQFMATGLAQCTIGANDELVEAVYDCDWINRDVKFQRALRFILQRSQQTNVIMAGNIIPVRLPTFVKVMKTAYSVFTVLSEMN